ncbi:Crp/Fnr family transcriptional regulator [Adlercreutzia sp. R21]|uniref:Crp/Fnr family transcriptional regulator n=1 Tax=Adlercreutzia wanghongyangiae TaxID=3111451 RepID=UPI002DBA369A|nr:Crp/Fnr family transcriptional regulator [Adlercreutzia sp. R21]MEC4183369.1 Crp/Fnr family transcriptional regulator [Adlercreutzia sp. R21]
MKANDAMERMRCEALHCPIRAFCPLSFLCARQLEDGRFILPVTVDVGYHEMVWTDLTARRRVYVVRSGLLVNKNFANDNEEIPSALFSPGFVGGVPDIYIPYVASDFYFFYGLVDAQVCEFDGDVVREQIDGLGVPAAQLLLSRISLNQATAAYSQTLTLAHQRARQKVASVLLRLERALARSEGYEGVLPVAHDDIASLACAERATISREMKALAEEGCIEIGYRKVRVLPPLRERYGAMIEANLPFYDDDWRPSPALS